MEHDFSVFGKRLKAQRKKKGLNQAQLGEMVWPIPENGNDEQIHKAKETARKKIQSYEKGKYPKDYADLCKICDVLECSLDYLFGAIDLSNHKAADIQAATGLSSSAIMTLDYLVAFAAGFDGPQEIEKINVLRFYSEFISNDELIDIIASSSLAIDSIRKNGLPENGASVFRSADPEAEAINYYTYLIEQTLIDFVKDFVFSSNKHLPIVEHRGGFNVPQNDEEYEERRKRVIAELEKYNKGVKDG